MFDEERTVIPSSFIHHTSEGVIPVRSQHCADSERFEGSVPSGAMPSNSVQTDEPSVSDWGAMVRTGLGRFPRWRYWRIYVTCQDHQPLQYYQQNLIQIKPLYNSNQQHSRIITNSFSRDHKLSKTIDKTSECSECSLMVGDGGDGAWLWGGGGIISVVESSLSQLVNINQITSLPSITAPVY